MTTFKEDGKSFLKTLGLIFGLMILLILLSILRPIFFAGWEFTFGALTIIASFFIAIYDWFISLIPSFQTFTIWALIMLIIISYQLMSVIFKLRDDISSIKKEIDSFYCKK